MVTWQLASTTTAKQCFDNSLLSTALMQLAWSHFKVSIWVTMMWFDKTISIISSSGCMTSRFSAIRKEYVERGERCDMRESGFVLRHNSAWSNLWFCGFRKIYWREPRCESIFHWGWYFDTCRFHHPRLYLTYRKHISDFVIGKLKHSKFSTNYTLHVWFKFLHYITK